MFKRELAVAVDGPDENDTADGAMIMMVNVTLRSSRR